MVKHRSRTMLLSLLCVGILLASIPMLGTLVTKKPITWFPPAAAADTTDVGYPQVPPEKIPSFKEAAAAAGGAMGLLAGCNNKPDLIKLVVAELMKLFSIENSQMLRNEVEKKNFFNLNKALVEQGCVGEKWAETTRLTVFDKLYEQTFDQLKGLNLSLISAETIAKSLAEIVVTAALAAAGK